MLNWSETFRPLLGPAMNAVYEWPGQTPKLTPSMRKAIGSKASTYEGKKRTNCTWFTAYFIGTGMDVDFTENAAWVRWQIAKGENYDYRGYGPGVCADQGLGTLCKPGAKPTGGVFLIQTLGTWPYGHSWIVLDHCPGTDRILTLESNTAGSGLDGVGFGGLGPIRTTNAANWQQRTTMQWTKRTKSAREVHMTKLNIDHASVRAWIAEQK
jgi:hypothetical protein